MKIELTGSKSVIIKWIHLRKMTTEFRQLQDTIPVLYTKVVVPKLKGGITGCHLTLTDKNGEDIVNLYASVVCSKQDNYCKAEGRARSLTELFSFYPPPLSKADRTLVWEAILNGTKAQVWKKA